MEFLVFHGIQSPDGCVLYPEFKPALPEPTTQSGLKSERTDRI